jgi:phosphoribosylformylglycinamidine synthase
MQDLVDCVRGLADAARAVGLRGHAPDPLPFVSGNVSLYNQSARGRAIPPTPVVACLGVVADVGRCRVPAQRSAGDVLFRVGTPDAGLGGSLYAQATGQHELLEHGALPPLRLQQQRDEIDALLDAFERGWITACRDVSAGGDIVALAEMSFGRHHSDGLGARIRLDASGPGVARLFAEAPGFVCAVSPAHADAFVTALRNRDVAVEALGSVEAEPVLEIVSGTRTLCRVGLDELFDAWRSGLEHVVRAEVPA